MPNIIEEREDNYGMGHVCVLCKKLHGRKDSGNVCAQCSSDIPL